MRAAIKVNKDDITKVFNEAYNNDQAIKVLDTNQGDLTKAVQYLEDQNAKTAKAAKQKVAKNDTTIETETKTVVIDKNETKEVDDANVPSMANSDFTNMVQKETENVSLIMAHVDKTIARK